MQILLGAPEVNNAVRRVERGLAYWFTKGLIGKFSVEEKSRIAAAIHDRMTEVVLSDIDAAEGLFSHVAPRPLASIDLLGRGRAALAAANTDNLIINNAGAPLP